MASEAELADLFLTLRAVNAPLLRAFEESTAAGESMVTALTGMFAEIDAMLARAAESAAALRAELAGVGESAGAAGAVGGGAAVAGAAEGTAAGAATAGAGAGAAAEAEAAAVSTATNEEVAAWDRVLAEMAQVRAETAMTAQADATEWSAMATKITAANEEMIASTKAYGDTMAATGVKVDEAAAAQSTVGAKLATITGHLKGPAIAAAIVGVAVVKMAADYETSTNRLLTSGGEIQANIGMVRKGMLDMASDVGVSAEQLAKHMYVIESAGYHGAEGLGVLKSAEQGAKAEGADATTVADALSSAMRDYYPNAKGAGEVTRAATDVMSKFIGATSAGKMTFQDMASALHSVLPAASVAKVSLDDVLGALAAMTVHGVSADQATQNLAHAIGHLQTVTQPQAKELALLGMTSQSVSRDLGTKGLTGTVQEVANAIQKQMGPQATTVVLNLQTALSHLSPAVQDLGRQALDGSMSWGEYSKAAKSLPVEAAGQAMAFATLAKSTHGIGMEQKSGATVMQTYSQALKAAMGDQTGMNVALMLTGQNTDYTNRAVQQISRSTADAQGNVKGWADIQGTANQKLSEAKAGLESLGITIGQKLLPVVTKIAGAVASASQWLSKHGQVASILAGIIGGVLVVAIAAYTAKILWSIGETAVGFVMDIAKGAWWVATKLGQFLTVSGSAASEAFATAGRWVYANATVLASEAADGAVWVATAVKNFVAVSAAAVIQSAKTAAAWLAANAKLAGQALASLATWAAETAARYGAAALAAASSAGATTLAWLGAMAAMTGQVIAKAAVWVAGMAVEYGAVALAAIVSAATTVAAWVAANLALIVATGGIILLIGLLVAAGVWVVTHWAQVKSFFVGLWHDIQSIFDSAVHGAVEIIKSWYPVILGILSGGLLLVPALIFKYWHQIVGFFSDAGKWLWNAGKAILEGLLGGLKAAWNAVTGFIGGIGNWISSHKGPIEVDRQLLAPHGNAIMQGLLTGLQAGGKHVVGYLDDFTQSLGAAGGGAVQVGMQVAGMSTGGMAPFTSGSPATTSGGGGVTVNVYVAGSVSTENQLVRAVQQGILQLSGRNSGFGLAPAFQ